MLLFAYIILTGVEAAGPNAAFEISANGRRLQPLATASPSPINSQSYSVGPTVSISASVSNYVTSGPIGPTATNPTISNHISASNYVTALTTTAATSSAAATATDVSNATTFAASASAFASAATRPDISTGQATQSSIFTDIQWTAVLVPAIGFTLILLYCVYVQHVRIARLENQLQKPTTTRYQVPYHSAVRNIITGNEPTNYV